MKRLALTLAAFCTAALLAWIVLESKAGVDVADNAAPAPVAFPEAEHMSSGTLTAPGGEVARLAVGVEPAAMSASAPSASRADHPWNPLLGAVTGRVVDAEGTPLPGRRIRLSELIDQRLNLEHPHPFGDQSLVVGEDTTDSRGEYTIRGALPDRVHQVSVDPLGTTALSRFVYQSIEAGGTARLEDLVVQVRSRVTGRALGPDGEPLVGAKVELLEDREELPSVVYGVVPREGGTFAHAQAPEISRYESVEASTPTAFRQVSGRLADSYHQWTRSTVSTGDDGRFTIESGLSGSLRAFVSFQALTPVFSSQFEGSPDGHDLGDLQLVPSPRLRGRVIDADGAPVEGAEVRAAPVAVGVGFLEGSATISAPDGSFSVEPLGVRDDDLSSGRLVAARGGPSNLWSGVTVADETQAAVIKLWKKRDLRLEFRSFKGEPITELRPRLVFLREGDESTYPSLLPGNPWGKEHCEGPDENGVFVFPEVELCIWGVRFQVGDGPTWTIPVTHSSGSEEVVLVQVPEAVMLPVEVVQRAGGAPIAQARLTTASGASGLLDASIHSPPLYTNAAGRSSVWAVESGAESTPAETYIIVEHPLFASQMQTLEPPIEGPSAAAPEPITFQLGGSGAIEGRVTWGGAAPDPGVIVALLTDDGIGIPRTQVTDEAGSFRFAGLAPGVFRVLAKERENEGWIRFQPDWFFEPDSRSAMRTVAIKADETQSVLFDFQEDGAPRQTTLTGRVTINGEVPLRGRVGLDSWEDAKFAPLDAAGQFNLSCDNDEDSVVGMFTVQTPLAAGPVELRIYMNSFDLESPSSTGKQPSPQELNFDVVFVEATVHGGPSVTQPIEGATCSMNLTEVIADAVTTDSDGRVLLAGLLEGPQTIEVSCFGKGAALASVTLEGGKNDRHLRVDIFLLPPVLCAGRCDGVSNALTIPEKATLWVYDEREEPVLSAPMADDYRFRFEGLTPGTYDVVLTDGEVVLDAPMELESEGAIDLILLFSVR